MSGDVVNLDRWRDFNDAEPQRFDGTRPWDDAESTEDIKSRMLVNIRGVLSYLLPGGVFQGTKFLVGDVHGNRGDSLTVELAGPKAGMWHDFATKEGSDIIGLWAAVTGRDTRTDFPAIMDDIREWLDGRSRTLHDDRAAQAKNPPTDELGPVTAKWDYLDEDGRLIACVYRYDPPGGKQFRPWDVQNRKMKAPDPRPLYNRPGIKLASEVILVEGEKAAQALNRSGALRYYGHERRLGPGREDRLVAAQGQARGDLAGQGRIRLAIRHGRITGCSCRRCYVGVRFAAAQRQARQVGYGRRGGRGHGRFRIHRNL